MHREKKIIVVSEQPSWGWGGPVDYMAVLISFLGERNGSIDLLVDGGTNPEFLQTVASSHVRVIDKNKSLLLKVRAVATKIPKPLNYFCEALILELWMRKKYPRDTLRVFSVCSPGRYLFPRGRHGRSAYVFHSEPTGTKHARAAGLFRFLLGKNARIIPVAQYVGKEITNVWRLPSDSSQITPVLNPAVQSGTGRPYSPRDRQYVLMVGWASDIKNPWFWLTVAKFTLQQVADPNLRFRWVGSGPLLEEMQEWVERENLTDQIELPGYDPEPFSHYSEARLYLHLSKREMASLAAIDAIQSGLPLVVSNVGGSPELCESGRNGITVELDDPLSVSTVVAELVSDEARLNRFSAGSREVFEEKFRLEDWKDKMSSLLFGDDAPERPGKD